LIVRWAQVRLSVLIARIGRQSVLCRSQLRNVRVPFGGESSYDARGPWISDPVSRRSKTQSPQLDQSKVENKESIDRGSVPSVHGSPQAPDEFNDVLRQQVRDGREAVRIQRFRNAS